MSTIHLDAAAGFHLAQTSTDHNVALAEHIGVLEKERVRIANEPEIVRLANTLAALDRERRELRSVLGQVLRTSTTRAVWPIWQTIMFVVFVCAGFAFTRMFFESFDLDPAGVWLMSIGIACLCVYATSEVLERMDRNELAQAVSIALFIVSLAGLAILASVRGDIFALHLRSAAAAGDPIIQNGNGVAFYSDAAPKMRLFLTLLSLGLELAGGLALHAVRTSLRARRAEPSPERRRLEAVEREIAETEGQLRSLRNEPELFQHEFRRNLYIGLLQGAVRHARSGQQWLPAIMLFVIASYVPAVRAEAIDLQVGIDYSATSQASNYTGTAAHAENIEAASRLIATVPSGSRVTVSAISDQSFARPLILVRGQLPENPGRLKEFDQIAAARQKLGLDFRRASGSVQPRFQSTDILGFLEVTGMALRSSPQMRHVIVIYSDMRQSAPPLDIERGRLVPVKQALLTVESEQSFPDLSGTDVYVYGVHSVDKDVRYWQSLREFWVAYFARAHANLRAFSMLRDTPNLGEPQ